MAARVDRVGETHGKLTVIARADKGPRSHWVCVCKCGSELVVSNSNLVTGNTRSCGCDWKIAVKGKMIGAKFGKLTVVSQAESRPFGKSIFAVYDCSCECGGSIRAFGMSLRNGDTISCGCAYKASWEGRRQTAEQRKEMILRGNTRRRAARLSAYHPFDHGFFELVEREAYSLRDMRSVMTGVRHEVDHIIPLRSKRVCGLHNEFNFAVITSIENNRKGNRYWPDMP